MQTIPVDQTRIGSMVAISVGPDLDRETNEQRATRDGEPMWRVEVLHRPEQTGDFAPRAGVEVVKIIGGAEPNLQPMEEAEFVGLTARHWSFNGRTGISLSADDVKPAKKSPLPDMKEN